MGLGRRQKREVIAAVGDAGRDESETEPQARRGDVRAENQRADHGGNDVAEDVFDRVRVDRCEADGGRPFVVLLVDVLVEPGSVKQAAEMETN